MLLIARFAIATLFVIRAVLGQESPSEENPTRAVPPAEAGTQAGFTLNVTPRIVRERMQELELIVELDRDFTTAVNGLIEVRTLLVQTPELEQRDELLIAVVRQHADLLLELGRVDEAEQLVGGLEGLVAQAAGGSQRVQQVQALLNAELVSFVQRVAALKARPSDELTAAVEQALINNDQQLLQELGTRAVPALVALLDLSQWGGGTTDPLTWLVILDPGRAAAEINLRLDGGTPLEAGRVVWALADGKPVRDDESWIATAGRSPRFARSEWLPILAWLTTLERSYDVGGVMLKLLRDFAERDALTPELVAALATRLEGDNARITQQLLDMFAKWTGDDEPVRVGSHRSLWERSITSARDGVRLIAAQGLLAWDASPELLARVDDPDPRVRRIVALALATRDVREIYFKIKDGRGSFSASARSMTVVPRLDDRAREVLGRLARDGDMAVRLAAVDAVVAASPPLGADVYLALADDPDVSVRTAMVALRHPDRDVQREVFARLADDADPLVRLALTHRSLPDDEVRAAVLRRLLVDADGAVRQRAARMLATEGPVADADVYRSLLADPDPLVRQQLASVAQVDEALLQEILVALAVDPSAAVTEAVDSRIGLELEHDGWDDHEAALLAAVRARRFSDRPRPWNQDSWHVTMLARRSAGRLELTRWALKTGQDQDWMLAFEDFKSDVHLSAWKALTDDELRALLAVSQRLDTAALNGVWSLFIKEGWRPAIARELLWEASTHAVMRLTMASALAPDFDAAAVDRLVDVLVTIEWSEGSLVMWTSSTSDGRLLKTLVSRLPRPLRGRFQRAVVADGKFPEQVALGVLESSFEPSAAGGEELIAAVLERWYDPDGAALGAGEVHTAIGSLHLYPDSADRDFLVEVLGTAYAPSALRSLAALRDPELLDDIAAVLRTTYQTITPAAVAAIVAYMSDEAAQVLLDVAATAPEAWRREACMQGVREILDYQDARQAWEQRLSQRQTREATIGQLVTLLTDSRPQVRIEATRGLASLGALDQLPAIIGLLGDTDPGVRAAAQAALDLLNQPAEQR